MNANGAGRGRGGRGRGALGAGRGGRGGRGGLGGAMPPLRPAILNAINEAVKNAHNVNCMANKPVSDSINELINTTIQHFQTTLEIDSNTDKLQSGNINQNITSLLKKLSVSGSTSNMVVTEEDSPEDEAAETPEEEAAEEETPEEEAAETPEEEAAE